MLDRRHPPTAVYRRTVNRLGLSLTLFFVMFWTLTGIVEGVFLVFDTVTVGVGSKLVTALYGLLSAAAYMAPFFIAGALFYGFSRNEPTQRIRSEIKLPPLFPLYVIAALGINTAAAYLNSFLAQLIGFTLPPEMTGAADYSDPATVVMYMTVALAPAFAEEFLFRGVVFGNLRPYGRTQAVLISALAFSLMHQNPAQLLYTFVCGVMLALMYEWTGSIWCSIIFHMFNNELSVLVEVLYGRFGDAVLPLLYLWDIALIVLSVVCVVILCLYHRKQKSVRLTASKAFYATDATRDPEAWDAPVSKRTVLRALRTPGMLAFFIFAGVVILLLYVMVLLTNLGGLV